jgi:UDP-N-acetylmuramate--alanine ligase
MSKNIKYEYKSVLLLGVGGISMYQIALALKDMGLKVYGYDIKESSYTKKCKDAGIEITTKFKSEFLKVDFCIKSAAVNSCKFLTELKNLGVKIYDRAEVLGFLASKFKQVIAVARTHGKSTTASLIYEILRADGRKVSCHIGADVYASRFNIEDDYLVMEACEYNKSFLSFYPSIAVVTNVEADHLDSYGSMFNLKNAFSVFLRRGKLRFINDNATTNYLKQIKDVCVARKTSLKIKPKIVGEHNMENISMAVAVCGELGVKDDVIIQAVNAFVGVPRRYEFLGIKENSKIYIDYAHHPTEINAFVDAFKNEHKDFLIIFQPHTFSRTKYLLKQFVDVLSKIENLIIFKEYAAREKPWQGVSAYELYEQIKQKNLNVKYFATYKGIVKNLPKNSAIAFVGAGNIDQIAKKFIKTY